MTKRWKLLLGAVVLLVGGWFVGSALNAVDEAWVMGVYQEIMPEAAAFEPLTDTTARALDAQGNILAYVGFSEQVGWGGSMVVGTIVDPDTGGLHQPIVVEHNETASFLGRVTSRLGMYTSLFADSPITVGLDLDTVTGATITNIAISNAVRDTAHTIAATQLGMSPQAPPTDWQFGAAEIAVILVFVAGFAVSQVAKLRKYRMVLLCINIFVLGFWLNRALSAVQFANLFLGVFPSPATNPLFYIVLIGALLPILLLGKNLYCTYICPFCGVLEVTNKLSGKNIPLGKNRKLLSRMRYVMLFLFMMGALVTANANFFNYEPFGTVFGLDLGVAAFLWIPVLFAVITGFFFKRLWCVALCPAGAMLDIVRDVVVDIRMRVKGRGCSEPEKKTSRGRGKNEVA